MIPLCVWIDKIKADLTTFEKLPNLVRGLRFDNFQKVVKSSVDSSQLSKSCQI